MEGNRKSAVRRLGFTVPRRKIDATLSVRKSQKAPLGAA
jgi:hypothetical protein